MCIYQCTNKLAVIFVFNVFLVQVKEKDLSVVIRTLEEEFSIYKEEGGESVPVHCQDVPNGLQRNGREGTGHRSQVTGLYSSTH